MKHFFRIASGVDVIPLLAAIHRHPELWDQHKLRTSHPHTPHKECSDIWVWFNEIKDDISKTIDDVQTFPYEAWDRLPQIRPIVFDLMRRVEATQLGRVIISRLPPGGKIDPHVDMGTPATFYTRFQVALQCAPGCVFGIGDEEVVFSPGEVWMIDNNSEHYVINNSKQDRIALIIDVRIP